jgi:aspartate kinase
MKVFKFGGASVKDAAAVRNVAKILERYQEDQIIVVVSAMGKTTNALEELLDAYFHGKDNTLALLEVVKRFHFDILKELFEDTRHPIFAAIHNTFVEIEWQLEEDQMREYDFEYDQMVAVGEWISATVVSAYLNHVGLANKLQDVRDLIRTDNTYRNAKVDWEVSAENVNRHLKPYFEENSNKLIVTQGFVGSTSENFNSTLGREGSDYTGGILANLTDADSLTIWKDVPGMLNADPKWFEETVKLNNISYHEAIELAYYGATVIHPKTIKPLQNKHIPLLVKSFLNPEEEGSVINDNSAKDSSIPSYIFKTNQILISISPRDYSFIAEENLSQIFGCFAKHRVTVNLMQNSAISFSICADNQKQKIDQLIEELKADYKVYYNDDLLLLTVRHYNEETLSKLLKGKTVYVEQKSRQTARFVVK